jgi:hypothetical protein
LLSPQASSHLGGANKKPELLYDGQHFDHWQAILKTDLSLEKRIEAVRAMGAFGANGYGPEAARAVLAAMRGYSIMEIDGSLEGTFKQAAFAAVTKLPRGEAFKPLAKTLENGNANQRVFFRQCVGQRCGQLERRFALAGQGDQRRGSLCPFCRATRSGPSRS